VLVVWTPQGWQVSKLKNLLQKNSGLAEMKAIKNILTGILSDDSLDVELAPSDIVNEQYIVK